MLSPERVIKALAGDLKASGASPLHKRKRLTVHPERDYRRPAVPSLVARLELEEYEGDAPLVPEPLRVTAVTIPLKQHVGVSCVSTVNVGDRVGEGDLIADIPPGALAAPIHASISGTVTSVDEFRIGIRA
jgi:biotin carboxyl carrier protein